MSMCTQAALFSDLSFPGAGHSREGGNPACLLMLSFPPKRKSTALDSRLRGNDVAL